MGNHTEKLKQQLIEVTDVVNAFKSEAVQLLIVERLLDMMLEDERPSGNLASFSSRKLLKASSTHDLHRAKKKPGATKVLYQLLATDFFNERRTISDIADYCFDKYDSNFKTSELSGILLKLAKEDRLVRLRSKDNNRFEYVVPAQANA